MIKIPNYIVYCSLIIFFISSVFLHFYRIGDIPNGFYLDESSIGYNAYSVLKTGNDEYGIRYPLFFRAFDNYHDPVMVYCTIPFIKILGLNKLSTRLPSAIFHILASIAFGFLVFEYVKNTNISILSAFFFSILPWSFCLSRINMAGYTPMLLGLNLGWLFLIKSLKNNSAKFAIISGLSFAFAMYSHNCGRPITAMMLACFLIAFNKALFRRCRLVLSLFVALLIALLPMCIAFLNNPDCMTSRFKQVSLYHQNPELYAFITGIIIRYFEYFSPTFLFFTGDNELRHNTGVGQLFIFLIPLILAGLFKVFKKRKNPYLIFLILCLFSYPVAAILTKDHMHGTRTVNGSIHFLLLSAVGFQYFISIKDRMKNFRLAIIALAVFSIVESYYYIYDYFGEYVERSRSAFNAPLIEIIETAFNERKPEETIYVSSSLFHHPVDKQFKPMWYSHFLFFGQIEPAIYQKIGIPLERLTHYNQEYIPDTGLLLRMNTAIIIAHDFNPLVILNPEKVPERAFLIKKIPLTKGSDRFFELYRF